MIVIESWQSTVWSDDFGKYEPHLAVDGDISTCAKTGFDQESYWIGDLGAVYPLHNLTIYGKCNVTRL